NSSSAGLRWPWPGKASRPSTANSRRHLPKVLAWMPSSAASSTNDSSLSSESLTASSLNSRVYFFRFRSIGTSNFVSLSPYLPVYEIGVSPVDSCRETSVQAQGWEVWREGTGDYHCHDLPGGMNPCGGATGYHHSLIDLEKGRG